MRRKLAALAAVAALAGCSAPTPRDDRVELLVFAAASLTDAMRALAPEAAHDLGIRLRFDFAGTSALARQISAADRGDVFVSADEAWMDDVAASERIDPGSRRTILSNGLVVVVPRGSELRIASAGDLAGSGVRRLCLADPDAVPAGRYARAWLERAGRWRAVRNRVVPAVDVRAALAQVAAGGCDAGIVYRTDGAITDRVRVAWTVPARDAPAIRYSAAALASSRHLDRAREFVAWLGSERAAATFARFGFVPTARDGA